MNELIKEIHTAFYTAEDILLKESEDLYDVEKIDYNQTQRLVELNKNKKELIDIGFSNSNNITIIDQEIKDIKDYTKENLIQKNKEKQRLNRAIVYFSHKYPHYKFITIEAIQKICKRYNLIHGDSDRFTGSIPQKNLQHIIDFKIEEIDKAYKTWFWDTPLLGKGRDEIRKKVMAKLDGTKLIIDYNAYILTKKDIMSKYDVKQVLFKDIERNEKLFYQLTTKFNVNFTHKDAENIIKFLNNEILLNFDSEEYKFKIVAPPSDFNMDETQLNDFELKEFKTFIPDPIVLRPVMFNDKMHYLIVTAWGEEASDESVINERMN